MSTNKRQVTMGQILTPRALNPLSQAGAELDLNKAADSWEIRRAKLEAKYGQITDVDFYVTNGGRDGGPYVRAKATFSDGLVRRYYWWYKFDLVDGEIVSYKRWLDGDNARRLKGTK